MSKRFFNFILCLVAAFGVIGIPLAYAAPLKFTTAESVSLTSPATSVTVATGSVADAFTVNGGNILVTLSSSTGGTFSLTSASYDLSIATSSGGETVTTSCTNGV